LFREFPDSSGEATLELSQVFGSVLISFLKGIFKGTSGGENNDLWGPINEAPLNGDLKRVSVGNPQDVVERDSLGAEVVEDSSRLPRIPVKPLQV